MPAANALVSSNGAVRFSAIAISHSAASPAIHTVVAKQGIYSLKTKHSSTSEGLYVLGLA